MLSNAYFLANFRFDTAENEPAKNLQNSANFPNFANQAAAMAPSCAPGPPAICGGSPSGTSLSDGAAGCCKPFRRENVVRFRLYRHRFLQENMRFAAFFKIYQILKLKFLKFNKFLQILRHLQLFC